MSSDQSYEDAMSGKRPKGVVEKLIEQYPEEMRDYRPATKIGYPVPCGICGGPIKRGAAVVAGDRVHADGPCEALAYRLDRDKWMHECRRLRKRVAELEAENERLREALTGLVEPVEQRFDYDPETGLCPNGRGKTAMLCEQMRQVRKARAALRGEKGEGDE